MVDENLNKKIESGSVKVADDVVAIISGVAATEIKGVAGMSGGIAGGITDMLGMKNLSKGVKIELSNKEAKIDIFLIVEYGYNITEVCTKVQNNVRNTVETMTGLDVVEVNINVQGVNIPKEPKKEEELKSK